METGSGRSRDEIEETLRQLGEDANAVRYPPLPSWFFLVMAAVVAGLALARMLEPADTTKATLGLGVVALVLGSRYWFNRQGVAWASATFRDMVPFLVGILGTFALSAVIAATTGAWWIWIVGAAVAAGIVLRTGHTYRQEYGG